MTEAEYSPRTPNVSKSAHCEFCCDDGYVLAGYSRAGTDQVGPCPFCERGFAIEFPERKHGPWGTDGFWRGRSTNGIRKSCTHSAKPVGPPPDWNDLARRLEESTVA